MNVNAYSYKFLLHYDILEMGVDPAYHEPDLSQIYIDALGKNWFWLYQAHLETTFDYANGMATYLKEQEFFETLVGDDPLFKFSWKEEYPSPVINILQQPAEAKEVLQFASWCEQENLNEVFKVIKDEELISNLCSTDITETNKELLTELHNYHSKRANTTAAFLDQTDLTQYTPEVIKRQLDTVDPENNGYLGKRFFSPHVALDSNPFIKKKDLDAELFRAVPYLVITSVHDRGSR